MDAEPTQQPVAAQEPNLERQLDDAMTYLSQYWDFRVRVSGRAAREFAFIFRHLVKRQELLSTLKRKNILQGKTTDLMRALLEQFTPAEEKGTDAYNAFRSDYVCHSISTRLMKTFPSFHFISLANLHQSRTTARLQFTEKHAITFVIAAVSFLLKEVPKSVIEGQFGIPQKTFEQVVFWVGLIAGFYLIILLVLPWVGTSEEKAKHAFFCRDFRVLLPSCWQGNIESSLTRDHGWRYKLVLATSPHRTKRRTAQQHRRASGRTLRESTQMRKATQRCAGYCARPGMQIWKLLSTLPGQDHLHGSNPRGQCRERTNDGSQDRRPEEANSEYAAKLRDLARRLGFPSDYVERIQ